MGGSSLEPVEVYVTTELPTSDILDSEVAG